ncbi:hypothetical protein ACFXJ8_33095 [Nonomuraea sp. NPDC059194]|uniref:hypothetical protein n=1 Tax=Nonomuraea sp. NPDC059194 TaxID=3346764 RepID=UPI0036CF61CA
MSQPLPVQPPPPAPPTGARPDPAEGPGTVRLPYTPDELPPVVYAPPPKPRWHRVVIGVILFLVLVAALVFGAIRLTEAKASTAPTAQEATAS